MNERAEATVNTESIESLIESRDINQSHEYINPNGKAPSTRCYFFTAPSVDKHSMTPLISCSKMILVIGKNSTFGQVARLMPERAYVVKLRVHQL